jgi:hypothetical protein
MRDSQARSRGLPAGTVSGVGLAAGDAFAAGRRHRFGDNGDKRDVVARQSVSATETDVTFIPLVLWLISDNHDVPEAQVHKALCAVESMAIRRTLLRMTMKDINKLVVAILRELDGKPMDQVGDVVERYLAQQTADSRSWPSDGELRELLPSIRLYGNIKQSRLRVLLSAVELAQRTPLTENLALPPKLELEHVMPRGWRTYWGEDLRGEHELAAKRDVLVDTLGNLTLVTKKLNGTLSNRPWRDDEAAAVTGASVGKLTLLKDYSILLLNKDIIDNHPESWTEQDIRDRSKQLTEAVISIWPRSGSPSRTEAVRAETAGNHAGDRAAGGAA